MTLDDLKAALAIVNVQAFLRVIREGESNQDESAYSILYGGGHFDSFADHPRKRFPVVNTTTSAAGAYQFEIHTWDALVKQFGFEDFSPPNQDLAAVALIAGRHALEAVIAGDVHEAIRRLPLEWTSLALPKRQAAAQAIFEAYGGTSGEAHQSVPTASAQTKEVKPMLPALVIPLIEAFGPSLVKMIPALGQLFGSGSEVQQRNIQAITMATDAIVTATGSPNLQAAVEQMQTDPAAMQAAKDAVHDMLPQIMEAGGGGIKGARDAQVAWKDVPLSRDRSFIIAVMFYPLIVLVVCAAIFNFPWLAPITPETRSMVIGFVMGTVAGAMVTYFFGSTSDSRKKTDLLAAK